MPSVSRIAWISSVSVGLSSRCRIRKGDFIMLSSSVLKSFSSFLSYASWWLLIDDCPENPKFFDSIDKLVEINRLYHVGVHAKFIARYHVSFLTRRREHYHRNHFQFLIRYNLLQHLQSIDLRQFKIKQQDSSDITSTHLEIPQAIKIIQGLFAIT